MQLRILRWIKNLLNRNVGEFSQLTCLAVWSSLSSQKSFLQVTNSVITSSKLQVLQFIHCGLDKNSTYPFSLKTWICCYSVKETIKLDWNTYAGALDLLSLSFETVFFCSVIIIVLICNTVRHFFLVFKAR